MKLRLMISLSICFLSQIGISQSFDKTKLDAYFDTLEVHNKFMGSVALSKEGKIIYTKQIGFSDVENKVKPNDSTTYRIGSITKMFTSVLVFKAIEANKIVLTDKLATYFPQIKNSQEITIANLLNHRSGIHNFTNDESYLNLETKKISEKELIEIIAKGGSDFKPDSNASYSNSNYVLLTFLLQKIYKENYSDLLQKLIVQPLQLKHTYFGKPSSIKENESFSYAYINGQWIKRSETDMSIPMGAGAIVSTPSDLIRFSHALFNGKLISEKSLQKMETLKDDYGMGLFQVPFFSKVGYGHTGGIDNFTSALFHFNDGDVSMAFTINGSNYNDNQISLALLSAVYGEPYDIPSFKTFAITEAELDKYLGIYSSKSLPLKITISKKGNTLIAQATNQPSFELTPRDKDTFSFEEGGIIVVFNPSENKLILHQGGEYIFTKE